MITVLKHSSFFFPLSIQKIPQQSFKKEQGSGIHNSHWKDDKGFVIQVVKRQTSKLKHFGDAQRKCHLPKSKL